MSVLENMLGKKFGKLTIIERVDDYEGSCGSKRVQYKSLCECGNRVIKCARDYKRIGDNNMCRPCRFPAPPSYIPKPRRPNKTPVIVHFGPRALCKVFTVYATTTAVPSEVTCVTCKRLLSKRT